MPAIAWWPGKIRPATASPALASTLDLFATIVNLAGLDMRSVVRRSITLDSVSLLPIILPQISHTVASGSDTEPAPQPREVMFLYNGCRLAAVRKGAWKAHYHTEPQNGQGGVGSGSIELPAGDHNPPVLCETQLEPPFFCNTTPNL